MNADERSLNQSHDHGEATWRATQSVRRICPLGPRLCSFRPLLHLRSFAFICGFILCFALLPGCRTDRITSSDGRPLPPKARTVAAAPASARVDRMVFMVGGKPEDTNRSGYPDLIRATVGLFSNQHPMAIRQDGEFVFELFPQGQAYDPAARPLATWRISGEGLERAMGEVQWGPSYHFRLSLLDSGPRGDEFPYTASDLRATFLPADGGPPIRNEGVRSIQIGRR